MSRSGRKRFTGNPYEVRELGQIRKSERAIEHSAYPQEQTSPPRPVWSEKCQKQTSPSRIHRYPSCLECVASPRTAEDLAPIIFIEGDWNGEGWSTLRSCTLPTTRPTLYAEWTDIELVRELSPGRAEVPVSYWQRRCRRQASHFNRPTSF